MTDGRVRIVLDKFSLASFRFRMFTVLFRMFVVGVLVFGRVVVAAEPRVVAVVAGLREEGVIVLAVRLSRLEKNIIRLDERYALLMLFL